MPPRRFDSHRESFLALLLAIFVSAASSPCFASSYLPIVTTVPDFHLLSSSGSQVSLHDLHGQVVVLTFMYTHCANQCPLVAERLSGLESALAARPIPARNVRIVSITFDPARDTAQWLKTYSENLRADPDRWLFLTGRPSEIRSTMRAFDFAADRNRAGDFDHASRVYLIDRAGRVRQIYSTSFLDTAVMVRDIDSLLSEGISPGNSSVVVRAQFPD